MRTHLAKRSFKRQIVIAFVVGFLVLASSFVVYLTGRERENLYRDSVAATTGLARSLGVSSLSWVLSDDVVGLQEVVQSFASYPELRYAMVVSRAGRVLGHSDPAKVGQYLSDPESLAVIAGPPTARIIRDDAAMADVAVPIVVGERHVGWARIGVGRARIASDLRKTMLGGASFVLLSALASLLAALYIATRLGRRIGTLVEVAEAVQAGNLATRAAIPGAEDEITTLADNLNQMLDALARNEARLRQASQYARSLIEASLDPLVTISPEGKITDVNEGSVRVTGVPREELIGTDFSDYFTEPEKAREGYQKVFADGFVTDYPLTIQNRDGTLTDVLYNASVYRDAQGEVLGVFAVARDVTETRRVGNELVRTKNLLDNILQSAIKYSIIGIDLRHAIVSWNEGARRNYGYAADEVLGKDSNILLHTPEDVASGAVDRLMRTAFESELAEGEFERIRKDGSRFFASVVVTRRNDPSGKPVGYLIMSSDISEKKQAEEALRESEERLRTLADYTYDWEYWEGPDRKIWYVTPSCERITGYASEEFLADANLLYRIIHPDDRHIMDEHLRDLGHEDSAPVDFRIIRRDGETRWIAHGCRAVYWHGDKYMGRRASNRDVTERKLLEMQLGELNNTLKKRVEEEVAKNREKDHILIQQSRLAAMGEMVHNIAHQWRQPLNALSILMSNIKDDYAFNELTAESLDQAVKNAQRLLQRMSSTVDDFRDFFRPDRESGEFDMSQSVENALFVMEASLKNNSIEVEKDVPKGLIAFGYSNQFAQVVLNILANAKEAIQQHAPSNGRIMIRLSRSGDQGVLAIEDNGGGIPEDVLPKIFDPYFTTKEKGSGIGLYMSRMITERNLNGRIDAANTANGALVTITLPLLHAEAASG